MTRRSARGVYRGVRDKARQRSDGLKGSVCERGVSLQHTRRNRSTTAFGLSDLLVERSVGVLDVEVGSDTHFGV
jgi:hypothetical protein